MRVIAWASFVILGAGCAASAPTEPSSPGTRAVDTASVSTLHGTVFETTAEGRRPVPGAYLNILTTGLEGGYGITAYADAEGRYAVGNLHTAVTALVHAMGGVDGAGVGRHQPCVAKAVIRGDTVLDVEFNRKDVRGSGGSPTVSGVVFETTAAGRQPVRGREVFYYAPNVLAAYTMTDDNGRFEFCKVPVGGGKLLVTNPIVGDWDFGGDIQRIVNVSGDVVVDVDVTR
jgi:hypothetical protein